MRVCGLTGGIATGKSTVSAILTTRSTIPIIDADLIAKEIVKPSTPAYYQIKQQFPDVIASNGLIDREALGTLIFKDPIKRKLLNSITHPLIKREMLRLLLWYFITLEGLAVLDVPLLFEGGLDKFVNKTVLVYCPEGIQKTRLIKRNNITDLQAAHRISSQMPIDDKKSRADIIIDNTESLTSFVELERRVLQIFEALEPSWFWNFVFWSLGVVPATFAYLGLTLMKLMNI